MIENLPRWLLFAGAFFSAFLISYVSIPIIVKISKFKKIFDEPNHRTSHSGLTSNLGGLSIFAGFTITCIVFSLQNDSNIIRYMLGGIIVLFFVGLKDDILVIDPKKKLLGQLFASLIIVLFTEIRITDFHGVLGINGIPLIFSLLFTIFLFVVLINGFNLIDGVDGLSSGTGIFVSIFFGVWFILTRNTTSAILAFSLAGSLCAFFRFNIFSKNNKIFLGDTGSMITGFIIAILTIQFIEFEKFASVRYQFSATPAVAIGLLIIPLFDTFRVFILRLWNGKSPFKADRNHMHHGLLSLGLSHLNVTIIMISFNLLFIIFAILLQTLGNVMLTIIMVVLAALLSCVPGLILKYRTR